MDGILGDLSFCVCYIDNILISKQEHLQHISTVLDRLQQSGLVVRYDNQDPPRIHGNGELLSALPARHRIHHGTAFAGKPKDLTWGPSQADAFHKAKEALAVSVLAFPTPGKPLFLTTDTSNNAIGAVLEQVVKGLPRPLSFFSRKLLKAKKNSAFHRELLAFTKLSVISVIFLRATSS
ncbi:uncharacterized protein LOC119584728 [Penaeus monodon]|uniref:uncharacterized protein LOC119584728 n=1 Tax=Penaeus monodon TaxID=6687 RepID=UPI0018A7CF88|nr:uncharacterized protein LOC119584728 [Penaeus monodon]